VITREIEIRNKLGLHARAAAKLVHLAARFASDVKVKKNDEEVDAKSILGVLLLAAPKGSKILLVVDGEDEAEAAQSIEQLFESKFDESE
jgi:phosphocarrier protein HPr